MQFALLVAKKATLSLQMIVLSDNNMAHVMIGIVVGLNSK